MEDVLVTLCVLFMIVCACEFARARAAAHCGGVYGPEIVSTLQLCACAHELKLLSEREPGIALALTYVVSVVHALTFRGAHANPSATLECLWRDGGSSARALARCTCQFAAAVGAGLVMRRVWSLGLSGLHTRHARSGFQCASPSGDAPVLAAVELACAFTVHMAAALTRGLEDKLRVHAVAGVITLVVYTGGGVTGAVFNPALALSAQFPCSGSTFTRNCVIYWLGPVLGMACSLLLFDKVIPAFTAKSTTHESLEAVQKKRKKKTN